MGDCGDDYKALKEHHKEEKKRRYEEIRPEEKLEEAEVLYQIKNGGYHLIVLDSNKKPFADFWPTTGKWLLRSGKRGHGVKRLIKIIKEE